MRHRPRQPGGREADGLLGGDGAVFLRQAADQGQGLRLVPAGKQGGPDIHQLQLQRRIPPVSLSRQGDRLTLCLIPVQGKVDLTACPYLLRLQGKEAT